jgi:hypothetical protein
MKQIFALLLTVILSANFFSCADQTYAKQLKNEEKLIKQFLKENNKHGEYQSLEDGMYFRLLNAGDTQGDSIQAGNLAIIRFKSITLTTPPDTISNWNVIDFPFPPQFVYGTENYACEAWLIAIALMKYQNSEAEIIAPSKTGFNSYNHAYAMANWGVSDDGQTVTPRRYILILTFEK